MPSSLRLLLAGLIALVALSPAARAQSYTQTSRPFVRSPQAIAMGDAVVAFPSATTAFFYNPAHLTQVDGLRPHITILGVQASTSTGLFDQIDFVQGDLMDAIDTGVDNLPYDEQRALFDDALQLGASPSDVTGGVLLPSVVMRLGDLGVGAGLFAQTGVRYQFPAGSFDVPNVDLIGQGDVMGVVSAAYDFSNTGFEGLSTGLTAKFTHRYLSAKDQSFLDLSPETDVYLYTGNSVSIDLGALYEFGVALPLPGTFRAGFALYDLFASDFEYTFSSNLTENATDNEALIASEEASLRALYGTVSTSYRFGLSYMLPGLPGLIKETGVSVDYLGYSDPLVEQPFLAHVHLGAQVKITSLLALRAGLNQGYTTLGAGLDLGFMNVDYAYYGTEGGRLPGQVPVWNHQVQLAFGIF